MFMCAHRRLPRRYADPAGKTTVRYAQSFARCVRACNVIISVLTMQLARNSVRYQRQLGNRVSLNIAPSIEINNDPLRSNRSF